MGQTETKLDLGRSGQFKANYEKLNPPLERGFQDAARAVVALWRELTSSRAAPGGAVWNQDLQNKLYEFDRIAYDLKERAEILEECLEKSKALDGVEVPPTLQGSTDLKRIQQLRPQWQQELDFIKKFLPSESTAVAAN